MRSHLTGDHAPFCLLYTEPVNNKKIDFAGYRRKEAVMYGAIIGDMIGAPYEFDQGDKRKDFQMWNMHVHFTDDTVMTIAVAEALMNVGPDAGEEKVKSAVIESMQKWGRKYPNAGYGGRFIGWLADKNPKPYGSWGNGSAMRVSAVGWLYDTIERTREVARWTSEVTHNHPEGVKGAESTAAAIFLARNGKNKDEIKDYIISEFGYDLSRTCDEIRPSYHHVESCQETVPEAITAFLEGNDFEDVIRTAVSLGGDCDTLTCISGSIAEAFYGISNKTKLECRNRLSEDIIEVVDRFSDILGKRNAFHDPFLEGNEIIEEAIERYHTFSSMENIIAVLESLRQRMHADGHLIFPVETDEDDAMQFSFRGIRTDDGGLWNVAFTSYEEFKKGEPSRVLSNFMDVTFKGSLGTESRGFIINPWGQSFMLSNELIGMIFAADGDEEYHMNLGKLTEETLEDGSLLKKAISIFNRNRTQHNMLNVLKILRDSYVYVPCNAIMSEEDNKAMLDMIHKAEENGGVEDLEGEEFVTRDIMRFVPDILYRDDKYYFPAFSSNEEMGEYGKNFSKIAHRMVDVIPLAKNNEKNVCGIVINAFSEPFILDKDLFDLVLRIESDIEGR